MDATVRVDEGGALLEQGKVYRWAAASSPASTFNERVAAGWAGWDLGDLLLFTERTQLPGDWPADSPRVFNGGPLWGEGTWRGPTQVVKSWPLPNNRGEVVLAAVWEHGDVAPGPSPSPAPPPSPGPRPAPAPSPSPAPQPLPAPRRTSDAAGWPVVLLGAALAFAILRRR